MEDKNQHLETLQDIKQMMERSSKFISLSGLSGITAGICALIGVWVVSGINKNFEGMSNLNDNDPRAGESVINIIMITWTGIIVFIAALVLAVLFTYLRSKKTGIPMWGTTARRLIWNTALPILAGGVFIIKLIELKEIGLIAPSCLIFYGLALINGSKYTLGEVRYLGYGQIMLGIINLWMTGYGLYFWAAGFGVLHIIYGLIMWWKYERKQ